jgi:glycosyltransferase involved in cell wall biosynthesis
MNIAWLSSDPVTQRALGVTARIAGARFLARAGHRVTVVCGAPPGSRPIEDVDTRLIESTYVPFLAWRALWPGVTSHLEAIDPRPDVVISDFALLPPAFRWARNAGGGGHRPRIVLDIRSHPVEADPVRLAAQRARFAMTLRWYGRRVDAVTTISPGLRDHVGRLARLPPDRIPVWTTGCVWCDEPGETNGWPPELDPSVRQRFVVIYQGSLSAGRGLFEAVQAVSLVRRSLPDVLLVFLGDGSARRDLQVQVESLGLRDHVWFLDPVPHERVSEFLGAADVGLAPWPATWDMEVNRPLKLAEYLCFGLPVILTDVASHHVIPADASFAFWAPAARPSEIADAILAAHRRRAELPALGAMAKAWALPRLGWSPQFAILEDVLTSVVQGPSPSQPPDHVAAEGCG